MSFPPRINVFIFDAMSSTYNIFVPMQNLQKAPRIEPGGLCSFLIFRKEDVLSWPVKDPENGYLATTVQLKPGKSFYLVAAVDKDRTFNEDQKYGDEGSYWDMTLTGTIAGNTAANTLSVEQMQFSEWGSIFHDRDGITRLIGDKDKCAKVFNKYSSADITGSRKRILSFSWSFPLPAPIYSASAFLISVAGVPVTAGTLTLIQRFQVGRPGAPMNDGDDELINAGFANKNLLVLASGIGLPFDDESGSIDWTGSIIRHVHKTYASDTLDFIGNVNQDEIIEIYAWS